MALKPQDLLVVLKLWVGRGRSWNYQMLANELGMSAAEAHNAVARAREAGLLPSGELSAPPSSATSIRNVHQRQLGMCI